MYSNMQLLFFISVNVTNELHAWFSLQMLACNSAIVFHRNVYVLFIVFNGTKSTLIVHIESK